VKAAFEQTLEERISCEFISDINDYILGAGYFYDTNFHLNDTGVVYRTQKLAEDINLARSNPYFISATLPEEPKLSDNLVFVEGVDENEEFFTYRELESGNWEISGLTEKGKAADTLIIPRSVQIGNTGCGIGVTAIGTGAFSGCSATKIVIPEDTNLRQIMNGAFTDAESVEIIAIKYATAEDIFPPTDNFAGASRELVIHVPDGSNYSSDYNWSENVKLVDIVPVNFD
jgi:vacuolar-type H+-ATPase subunit F/Vma7